MKSVQDNKTIKLSEAQKHIIALMREGWEMEVEYGLNDWAAIRKYRLVKRLNFKTAAYLINTNLLTECSKSKWQRESEHFYQLNELGKTIQL